MVNRSYICDSCNYSFTIKQNMHDSLKKKCPNCGKYKLYQDLVGQRTFVYQEPKTVGHLADRNTERAGKYELESARSKMPEKKQKKTSWYNPDDKDLAKELSHIDTKEKKQKYILKGEQ